VKILQKQILEGRAPSQFAALICPDTPTIFVPVLIEKLFDNVKGW
jgi:hypothetical protein